MKEDLYIISFITFLVWRTNLISKLERLYYGNSYGYQELKFWLKRDIKNFIKQIINKLLNKEIFKVQKF